MNLEFFAKAFGEAFLGGYIMSPDNFKVAIDHDHLLRITKLLQKFHYNLISIVFENHQLLYSFSSQTDGTIIIVLAVKDVYITSISSLFESAISFEKQITEKKKIIFIGNPNSYF